MYALRSMALPKAGELICRERYEVVHVIGEGGMGVVVEGLHLALRRRVAIKLLKQDQLIDPDSLERFRRETRALSALTSENVARVLDADVTEDGTPVMVMEFLAGHDLARELSSRGALPIAEGVDWLLQACAGVAAAHACGIVHRDLKPSNLHLAEHGETRTLKVLDFGIAKLFTEKAEATSTSMVMGTPNYMSPEQLLSSKKVDARTDIWSLAVVLYRILSGAFPFHADGTTALAVAIATAEPIPLSKRRADVPPALEAAIARALAKDRNERFATVTDFAASLRPFSSKAGVAPSSRVARPRKARDVSPRETARDAGPVAGTAPTVKELASRPVPLYVLPVVSVSSALVGALLMYALLHDPSQEPVARGVGAAQPSRTAAPPSYAPLAPRRRVVPSAE